MTPDQVKQLIDQYMLKTQYQVSHVPYHTHNGLDSPPIKVNFGGGVYSGHVASDGTAVLLPLGWTSTKNSTGIYTITHNLNNTNYVVVANPLNTGVRYIEIESLAANSFKIFTYNSSSSGADSATLFILQQD